MRRVHESKDSFLSFVLFVPKAQLFLDTHTDARGLLVYSLSTASHPPKQTRGRAGQGVCGGR